MSHPTRRSSRCSRLAPLLWLALATAGSPALAAEPTGSSTPPETGVVVPAIEPAPTAMEAASAESASPGGVQILARPKLEVQRGSGDFTTYHDSAVVDGSTPVRLRWSPPIAAAKARYSVRAFPIGPPTSARNAPPDAETPPAPVPGNWGYFDLTLFSSRRSASPPGPTRYRVTVTALNAQGEPLGQPSDPVEIDYQPPGSGPAQVIQLDQVQLLDWSPKSGVLNGPNDSDYYKYGPDQQVDLSFRIDLVTEPEARLRHSFVDQGGQTLQGNFFTFVDLDSAGVHTEDSWLTIRCDAGVGNAYYEQQAYGLKWKLFRQGSEGVLSEGVKMFGAPLTWRCPGNDQLVLTSAAPAAGALQGIETPADASKPGRAVQLQYQYRLGSQPKAVVKQVPLMANYQPVQHEYWTETKVTNGSGFASNVLSVYCQSELQPDVEVRYLRYSLNEEGSGENILQEVVPVNWRFSCKPLQINPALMQRPKGLAPSGGGSKRRAAPQRAPASAPAVQQVTPRPTPALSDGDGEEPTLERRKPQIGRE